VPTIRTSSASLRAKIGLRTLTIVEPVLQGKSEKARCFSSGMNRIAVRDGLR
jgi:hypothetical protein